MNSGINLPILLIPLLLLLAILLLIRGRKRWIGSEPYCRKCHYLLHGLTSERCPECGAVLSPAAIVTGQPRRRFIPFISGWLIILLLAIALIGGGIGSVQNINWYQYKPTWLVLRDLNSGNPATVQVAWRELVRRDGLQSLSADTRDKLVQFALHEQVNAKPPYSMLDTDTVNYLGTRINAGDLPKAQQTQIFEQSVDTKLLLRPTVVEGDRIPFLMTHQGLGPANGGFWIKLSNNGAAIDGKKTRDYSGGSSESSGLGGGSLGSSLDPCPPGKHDVALTFRVEIFSGGFDSANAKLLYRVDRVLTDGVQVIPKSSAVNLQAISDPKFAGAMYAGVVPGPFRYNSATKSLSADLKIRNLPANLACDVLVGYGGAEHSIGSINCSANAIPCEYSIGSQLEPPVPAKIDIILRPSEKVARGTVDMQSYWDQELIFSNIPVSRK